MAKVTYRKHFRWRDFRKPWPEATHVRDVLTATLQQLGVDPDRERLLHLWECWPHVLGAELAAMACPLGTHKDILLVGCEDNMLMQEVALQQYEILERVNAFMEKDYFHSVRPSLFMGRSSLAEPRTPQVQAKPQAVHRATVRGTHLGSISTDTPWGRCYAAYAGVQQ